MQFGHAGALALSAMQTAEAKNAALREAGALVPESFDGFPALVNDVYSRLLKEGIVSAVVEPTPPKVPMDYAWARNLGLIRKPSSFISSICDERGDELEYAGMPISEVFREDVGIGGVIGLLMVSKRLPQYASRFLK